MPRPAHTRLTFSGTFGPNASTPVEIWSWSLNMGEVAFGPGGRQQAADDLRAAWIFWPAGWHPNTVRLTNVRVAQVGADGHVTKDATGAYNQADAPANAPGTKAGPVYPLPTALCVSLETARDGATGKGRVFLPTPAYPLDANDFRLSVEHADQIAEQFVSFLGLVDAAVVGTSGDVGGNVAVVSSKGAISTVTGIRVGRVLDTMRSRRGAQLEGYVSKAVSQ